MNATKARIKEREKKIIQACLNQSLWLPSMSGHRSTKTLSLLSFFFPPKSHTQEDVLSAQTQGSDYDMIKSSVY